MSGFFKYIIVLLEISYIYLEFVWGEKYVRMKLILCFFFYIVSNYVIL